MSTAVSRAPQVSIAALLLTLASDAAAQQRAPLVHPPQDPRATSKMVAPHNSFEALDRQFARLDRRRLVVRPGPRAVNPEAARVKPNPDLVRTLEAHGRTLRAAPAAPVRQSTAVAQGATSARFPSYDCNAAKRAGLDTDHLVLNIRPGDGGLGFILAPGITYEATGCGLGRNTTKSAVTIPPNGDGPRVGAVIHAWSDSRLAFTLLDRKSVV